MLIPEVSISHRIEESKPRKITTPPATFKILCDRSSKSDSARNLPAFKSPVRCVANALQSKSLGCNAVQGHLPCKARRCGLARHVLKCLSKLGSKRVLLTQISNWQNVRVKILKHMLHAEHKPSAPGS